eukprot:gene7161-7968_t
MKKIRTEVVILYFMFITLVSSDNLVDRVNSWTSNLGSYLNNFTQDVTGYNEVLKSYTNGNYSVIDVNGTKVSTHFENSLSTLLESKINALMAIKDQVQTSVDSYVDDPNIKPFAYQDVHKIANDNVTLVLKPEFSTTKPVNTSYSFIQVPTNVYDKDPSVLNSVKWTKSLDDVFTKNYNDDRSLLWQYFGNAHNGVFRTYPGKRWNVDSANRDLYDCRRRGWFIQASSSPKDLIIVIDGSGTMIGNNFGIARVATLFLIDTLQENDFFNVIYFNVDVKFPITCLSDRLLQATNENRQKMKTAVNALKNPQKTGNVELAMETALKLLSKVRSKSRASSGCNQIISFFSDGVEGSYAGKNAFEKFNADKHVRVFSYLVGRKKDAPKDAMVQMACKNRGFFYQIETVGNIWDSVLKYLSVLSRPLALTPTKNLSIYTPLYLDASGLGMMMTVATAVFKNTTKPADASLLGVAGTDIAVSTLEDRIPYQMVGVGGYGFAINNNGFLLFHPKLRGQAGYLPSPPNVYLEDIELGTNNQSTELKYKIVAEETGHMKFKVYSISKNGKRVSEINMNYFYKPTRSTPFSTCMAIPDFGLKQLQATTLTDQQKTQGIDALKSDGNIKSFVAKWPFCNITAAAQKLQEISKKAYPTSEEIRLHLNAHGYLKCDETLVRNLLLSASDVTKAVKAVWNTNDYQNIGVDSVFLGTSSGFGRAMFNGSTAPITRNFFNEEFYEHAVKYVNMQNQSVVFSVPIKTTDTTPFTSAKKSVNKSETFITVSVPVQAQSKVFASVLGMKVKSSKIKEIFLKNTVGSSSTPSTPSCSDNNTVDCYLIDENGFIVASNGVDDEVGRFLGFVQGKLVKHLSLNSTNILKKFSFNDPQAECVKPSSTTSDATRLMSPFLTISGYMIWWTQTVISLLTQFSLFSSFGSQSQVHASTNISCTKQMNFYVMQETKLPVTGSVACSKSCDHRFVVSKLPKTNLAMVLMYKNCGKLCKEPKVSTISIKIPDVNVCNTMPRYRRLLKGCQKFNSEESTACGSASRLQPALASILLSTIAIAFWL